MAWQRSVLKVVRVTTDALLPRATHRLLYFLHSHSRGNKYSCKHIRLKPQDYKVEYIRQIAMEVVK